MRSCLFGLLLFCGCCTVFAQSSIFDALDKQEQGKGTVIIRQPWAIRSLVGVQASDERIETEGDKRYFVMPGYRIQVFAGNNQRTSKDEAESKQNQISTLFTGATTYIKYNAPFWRLYVGDYITYEEAFSMMYKLSEAFPAFRKEIQIKEEEIRIPLN